MENNFDIFISHSSQDHNLAYALCHYLEERDIRCWIAPRDVQGGLEYAEAIINGIRTCKVMVVIFNENANKSLFVKNEVERAFNYKSIIIPFKIDDTIPSATLELFLGSVHWLDAVNGSAENYFDLLYQNCARALGKQIKTTKQFVPQENPNVNPENNSIDQEAATLRLHESKFSTNSQINATGTKLKIIKRASLIISAFSLIGSLLYFIFDYGYEGYGDFLYLVSFLGIILGTGWLIFSIKKGLKITFSLVSIFVALVSILIIRGVNSMNDPIEIDWMDDIEDFEQITIASQVWEMKNLNLDTFRNGDTIQEAKTNEDWIKAGESKKPAWCFYNNDTSNSLKYGKIYNWFAINDSRGLAPFGYRIAKKEDWSTLIQNCENNSELLKAKEEWINESNKDSFGFAALPSGFRTNFGEFMGEGNECSWWSSSSNDDKSAFRFKLDRNSKNFIQMPNLKEFGFYVRCIKN